jgi:hypothetical protein
MIVDLDELHRDASVGLCVKCYPLFFKPKTPTVYKHEKCECGADTGGFQYHAYWCDMWRDPMTGKPRWQINFEKKKEQGL